MSTKIYENFLQDDEWRNIHDVLTSSNFPWYYNDHIINDDHENIWDFQFVHSFYDNYVINSNLIELMFPLMNKISPKSFIRIKANFRPATETPRYGGWHNDVLFPCKTAVYYVNTNDGFTEFEDGQQVDSVANRLVVFDSNVLHTGTSPTNVSGRIVVNINYIE